MLPGQQHPAAVVAAEAAVIMVALEPRMPRVVHTAVVALTPTTLGSGLDRAAEMARFGLSGPALFVNSRPPMLGIHK